MRKRKWLSKSGQKSNSPLRSVFSSSTDTPGDPGILLPPIDRNLDPNQPNPLDLNKNPASRSTSDAVSESNNMPSFSQEIEATTKVGFDVGFQIDSKDAILSEVMGNSGEYNRDQ